jgi:hypothetical protein
MNMNHDHLTPTGEHQTGSVEAETHPDLVEKYSVFRDRIHPKADVIYHPCSANDVSPSAVFPDSHVIYADLAEGAMEALAEAGYDAHTADVREFDPGKVDILFLLNPAVSPEVPSSHVAEGGFVVANDYHRTADWLHASGDYELKAIIKKEQGGIVFDDVNPEDYWKEVETEDEFRQASGNMNTTNYARAAQIVESVTGRSDNVLDEYKALVKRAQEEDLQQRHELWEQKPDPEMLAMFGGTPEDVAEMSEQPEPQIDADGPWSIEGPNGEMILLTSLPRKNGSEEDIFVFQKKLTRISLSGL